LEKQPEHILRCYDNGINAYEERSGMSSLILLYLKSRQATSWVNNQSERERATAKESKAKENGE
jgi:hypothetical protein